MDTIRPLNGFGAAIALWLLSPLPGVAQITPDTTLPVNSQVAPGCTLCVITGGTERGVNLYHSFEQFSVPTGGEAWFNNGDQIQNILTRVTGTLESNIDGLLRANGTANLFFLNPNGIVFGANAQLQIGGSFFATTANSWQFFDGTEFSAVNPQAPPLLTISITPGLQVGSVQATRLQTEGNLTAGQDLTLISDALFLQGGQLQAGQDLTLQGESFLGAFDNATAPVRAIAGGNLQLQSTQSLILFVQNHPESLFAAGGDLALSANEVLANGRFYAGGNLQFTDPSGNPANVFSPIGAVMVAGGNLSFGNMTSNDAVQLSAGGNLTLGNYSGASFKAEAIGSVQAGTISILRSACVAGSAGCFGSIAPADPDFGVLTNSPAVILRSGLSALTVPPNVPAFGGQTRLTGAVPPTAAGEIATGDINLDIFAAPTRGLPSGPVMLTARGDIRTGGIRTTPFTFGNTGGIFLTSQVGSIDTTGGSLLSGARGGLAGDIVLDAAQAVRTGNVFASRNGSLSGNVTLISRAGSIDTTSGTLFARGIDGTGGTITLTASDRIQTGTVTSDSLSGNNGGLIQMVATNGITAQTISTSSPFNRAGAVNLRSSQGDITVQTIDASGVNGGAMTITTGGNLTLNSATTRGFGGSGGAIALTAGSNIAVEADLASLSVSFSNSIGDGGAITLSAGNNITLEGDLTSLAFSSDGVAGQGGAMTLSAAQGSITSNGGSRLISTVASPRSQLPGGTGGDVTLTSQNQLRNLSVFTQSSTGQAGTVRITGLRDLTLNNTQVSTTTTVEVLTPFGPIRFEVGQAGRSGDVVINSAGHLTLDNSVVQSTTQSVNPAGNVGITSGGVVTLQNNSQMISNTSSSGAAGNIAVQAGQGILLADGSTLEARTSSSGSAGNVILHAPLLTVAGNAQISAETVGSGSGGNITVNAPTAVTLARVQDNFPSLSVEASGAGPAGNITINTPNLTLSDRARITATATATSTNLEGGGSITLKASNLNLAGVVGVFAETQGQAPAGTLRLHPYNNQPDLNIALTPNSQISASTAGSGNGGDLIATAPQSITIAGPGKLAVETSSTGNAGSMTFTTGQLTLKDGVEVSASTLGAGKAGDINLNAQSVSLSGGARVTTNTASSGQAGNLNVQVQDTLLLTGRGTGLFASTTPGSTGNGGNITIDPRLVQIEDGAAIAVNSQGSGTGGSITIQAGRLFLDRGSITAETASAQGGNVTLDIRDLLLLRRNSLISATAGTAQAAGNGGNINIRAEFIVGVLGENSDIVANAFTGQGGNITITTNAIFGLLPQVRLTPLSDITASSEFGLSGTIAINTLNVDPSRGLAALKIDFTDQSQQIGLGCAAGGRLANRESRFTVSGRGGVVASPTEPFTGAQPLIQLLAGTSEQRAAMEQNSPGAIAPVPPTPIIEAQGWQQAPDGSIDLVAQAVSAPIPAQPILPLRCDGTGRR